MPASTAPSRREPALALALFLVTPLLLAFGVQRYAAAESNGHAPPTGTHGH